MFFLLLFLSAAQIPPGEIVPDVKCEADPALSYALYLPRGYTPARAYPVIFAFDPGARGRVPVERYQAAAEQYGYIVAGSNNSRNGSPVTAQAATAMTTDVMARFNVDPNRIYLAGMSGGARVAFGVALPNGDKIAGHVWLSSELAIEAVEWMEVQAMKRGRAQKDQTRIDGSSRNTETGGDGGVESDAASGCERL